MMKKREGRDSHECSSLIDRKHLSLTKYDLANGDAEILLELFHQPNLGSN